MLRKMLWAHLLIVRFFLLLIFNIRSGSKSEKWVNWWKIAKRNYSSFYIVLFRFFHCKLKCLLQEIGFSVFLFSRCFILFIRVYAVFFASFVVLTMNIDLSVLRAHKSFCIKQMIFIFSLHHLQITHITFLLCLDFFSSFSAIDWNCRWSLHRNWNNSE